MIGTFQSPLKLKIHDSCPCNHVGPPTTVSKLLYIFLKYLEKDVNYFKTFLSIIYKQYNTFYNWKWKPFKIFIWKLKPNTSIQWIALWFKLKDWEGWNVWFVAPALCVIIAMMLSRCHLIQSFCTKSLSLSLSLFLSLSEKEKLLFWTDIMHKETRDLVFSATNSLLSLWKEDQSVVSEHFILGLIHYIYHEPNIQMLAQFWSGTLLWVLHQAQKRCHYFLKLLVGLPFLNKTIKKKNIDCFFLI